MYVDKKRTRRATIVTIFSHMTRDISVFIKCDTIFRLFFWKLPQFHTFNFRKVVRQHTEGLTRPIIWILLKIYLAFQQWKSFENPLRTDKVNAMSLVYYFFGTQCSWHNTEIVKSNYLATTATKYEGEYDINDTSGWKHAHTEHNLRVLTPAPLSVTRCYNSNNTTLSTNLRRKYSRVLLKRYW